MGLHQIQIEYSDGVASHLPEGSLISSDKPSGSHFDYFRRLSHDDPRWIRWMKTLGAFIKSETSLKDNQDEYVLMDMPANYTLLEHNKSQPDGKKPRTDMYVFGHPSNGRFRSTNEFMPHLLWLAKDKEHIATNCGCRLCPGGRGLAPKGTRTSTRAGRVRPMYTGMSEMGKSMLEKAREDMARDLQPLAPVFRVGEVVSVDGTARIVADAMTDDMLNSMSEALEHHSYTLLDLAAPYQRHEQVPHRDILPWLCRHDEHDASRQAPILRSASPIAKYSMQFTPTATSTWSGPSYVGFYLGPEKIYQNDLVRIARDESSKGMEIMQLNAILLDVASKTVMVRGDLFVLTEPEELPTLQAHSTEIPEHLRAIARKLKKHITCVSPDGRELSLPIVDVCGRFYHPKAFSRPLGRVAATDVVRGRVSPLPKKLVSLINHVFEESDAPKEMQIASSNLNMDKRTGQDVSTTVKRETTPFDTAVRQTEPSDTTKHEPMEAITIPNSIANLAETIAKPALHLLDSASKITSDIKEQGSDFAGKVRDTLQQSTMPAVEQTVTQVMDAIAEMPNVSTLATAFSSKRKPDELEDDAGTKRLKFSEQYSASPSPVSEFSSLA